MTRTNTSLENTRRRFLRDASLIAVAGATALPSVAEASRRSRRGRVSIDTPTKIDIGVTPKRSEFGGVVIPGSNLVFFAFQATQGAAEGIAVVEFTGCASWAQRAGDVDSQPHAINLDNLDMCASYEVTNSSWATTVSGASSSGRGRGSRSANRLRHFIFTFCGYEPNVSEGAKHFECLALGANVEFLSGGRFQDIVDYTRLLDAAA